MAKTATPTAALRPQGITTARPSQRRQAAALRELAQARPYGFLQAKLTVGPANDRFEQEADAVADRVMRMDGAHAAQDDRASPQPAGAPFSASVTDARKRCKASRPSMMKRRRGRRRLSARRLKAPCRRNRRTRRPPRASTPCVAAGGRFRPRNAHSSSRGSARLRQCPHPCRCFRRAGRSGNRRAGLHDRRRHGLWSGAICSGHADGPASAGARTDPRSPAGERIVRGGESRSARVQWPGNGRELHRQPRRSRLQGCGQPEHILPRHRPHRNLPWGAVLS